MTNSKTRFLLRLFQCYEVMVVLLVPVIFKTAPEVSNVLILSLLATTFVTIMCALALPEN